jgi:hypothetical protein
MFWGTPSTQFVPWWWQAWQTLLAGELPLWNPLVGMGAPLLANYQSALLYPPTWIYFALAAIGGLPWMAWGQSILVALHLAWAGWGMGLLIRRLDRSELAQAIGGLAFGLSGYLVARAHFLSINSAVAWLPWILLMAYEIVKEPSKKRTVLKLALVLTLQWLAGHAQIAWYTVMLAIAWTAFWAWKTGGWRSLASSALRFGFAGLLAFALSAAQLLPTAEYLANSQRATHVDFAQATTYSFWPWRAIGLLAPNFFGNPAHSDYWGYGNFWEDAIYIGLLPFLLALAGLWWIHKHRQQRSLVLFLLATVVVSFWLALGTNTPLFEWLYRNVITFALFQSPTRFSIWLIFALVLIAALAVDRWQAPLGRALYWSRLGAAAAAAIMLGAAIGWLLVKQGAIEAPETYFKTTLTMGGVAFVAALLHLEASSRTKYIWAWLVSGLVAVDMLVAGWGLNPGTSLELYKENAILDAGLRGSLAEGRLFISEIDEYELRYNQLFQFEDFSIEGEDQIRDTQLPNAFLLDGIRSANNYDPLMPVRYRELLDELSEIDAYKGMLPRMSVSIIEHVDNEDIEFTPLAMLSRVRIANCVQSAGNVEAAFSALHEVNFDPNVVIIEGISDPANCDETNATGSAQIISESANSVVVQVVAPQGGWLVLADMFYHGWQAASNGQVLTIKPADGVFRAVELEPGENEVTFSYHPMWFYVGAALSLVTWPSMYLLWKRNNIE